MRVRLHIQRLVLDGIALSAADRRGLQAAFETELTRLIGEGGLGGVGTGGAVPSLDTRPIHLASGFGPSELGARIASALYGGLRR